LDFVFRDFIERPVKFAVADRQVWPIKTLAETLGRPQSFVAKYESGERRLDAAEFVGIARALGADPFKLLKATEKRQS
jgi:transcriptional regulator with XRE-family HTH domain